MSFSPLLKIDSARRYSGTADNFVMRLNDVLPAGRYRLRQFLAYNSFYNITSSNNQVYFTDTQARVATLPPGFYTSSTLVSTLQAQMNSVSSGYSCSFSGTTGLVTITNASAFSMTFATLTSNSAAQVLGFVNGVSGGVPVGIDTASATSVTSPTLMNLSGTRCFNFIIDGVGAVVTDVSSGSSWAFSVPINVASGEIICYEPTNDTQQVFEIHQNTKQLTIKVVDDRNQSIPIQADWYAIVQHE